MILMISSIDNYAITTSGDQLDAVTKATPKQFMLVGTSISGCPRLRLGIVNGKKCLERGL